jgi:N-acetylmuramoyl-L-alanine amidase
MRCFVTLLALVTIAQLACRATSSESSMNSTPEPDRVDVAAVPDNATQADPMISVDTLHSAPDDFALRRIGNEEFPIPNYSRFLKGVRICLDPGHGGDAHQRGYKRGPTGVREAEMNLRIARYLRDFLESVGAEVKLTRDGDVDLSLKERAKVATHWGADLFISLHHNAVSRKTANFTTVWYHGGVDDRPSGLDLARYLSFSLHDALAFPDIATVPLKSDQLMYEGGFGVLRNADVTSALCETSFFTHPGEEQRLRRPYHNLREAWGLFIGLARYAASGLPRVELIEPGDGVVTPGQQLVFTLSDGLRERKSWGHERSMILAETIRVTINGREVPHTFTNEGYTLRADVPSDIQPGEAEVEVRFHNKMKNAVINPRMMVGVRE